MPVIPIHHVIFTRVERTYSPRNTSGYQIVYQSSALDREVAQIEKRLQCFETGKRESERYQFFWTDRDQAVVARTVPLLHPDPEVIDSGQRDAFLAHALVIGHDDFAAVRNDPFAVFEAAKQADLFAEDVEQLVAYLHGEQPAETLATPHRKPGDVAYLLDNWPSDQLARLFDLGLQAPVMSRQSQSLLLLSEDPDALYNLLSLLLWLIPHPTRGSCTFDTFVVGCYPSAGSLWAMGSSKDRPHPGLLPVRLQEQRLVFKGGGDGRFPDPKVLIRAASLIAGSRGCAGKDSEGDVRMGRLMCLIEYGKHVTQVSMY